jgi:hypothetical protein
MDPVTAFGLAAGALQFLQCAFDMTKDTYLAMKDARRDVLDLLAATSALSAVFATLGQKDPLTGLWQIAFPSLKTAEMQKLFTLMEREMNALGTQLSGLGPLRDEQQLRNKLRSVLPRLKWALRADEVKRITKQITTYQEVLSLAATTETLYVHCCLRRLLPDCAYSTLMGEALVLLHQQHAEIIDRLNDLARDQTRTAEVLDDVAVARQDIAETRTSVQKIISYEEQTLQGAHVHFPIGKNGT